MNRLKTIFILTMATLGMQSVNEIYRKSYPYTIQELPLQRSRPQTADTYREFHDYQLYSMSNIRQDSYDPLPGFRDRCNDRMSVCSCRKWYEQYDNGKLATHNCNDEYNRESQIRGLIPSGFECRNVTELAQVEIKGKILWIEFNDGCELRCIDPATCMF